MKKDSCNSKKQSSDSESVDIEENDQGKIPEKMCCATLGKVAKYQQSYPPHRLPEQPSSIERLYFLPHQSFESFKKSDKKGDDLLRVINFIIDRLYLYFLSKLSYMFSSKLDYLYVEMKRVIPRLNIVLFTPCQKFC